MGGSRYTPTAFDLRVPIGDAWVDLQSGKLTVQSEKYMTNLNQLLATLGGIQVVPSGLDITSALQGGINQAISQGGGVVVLPAGSYTISSVSIPANAPPISIIGQGWSTKLTRGATLAAGVGVFDIRGSYVTLSDFILDGGVTVPVGLRYNADFSTPINPNDPMAPSLTGNTSVWVHGPTSKVSIYRVLFQHAGGYSVLLDATTGDVSDIEIVECWLFNNRPTLFGVNPGQLIYGSWNGGILAKSDGRSAMGAQSGVVSGLLVQACNFQRNNGNCLWSHGYGFNRFNSEFRYVGNRFLDCGLDGILVDLVSGGIVSGNVMRRIGYTTMDDSSQSVPRWLVGLNATGIDSGVVKGVPYVGNSLTSVNGGMIDMDGHGDGSLEGNTLRIPYPNEPEYLEDQIAITGPNNNGNNSYGLNFGNTYSVQDGCTRVPVCGNAFINLPAGSIRGYSCRFISIESNLFDIPAVTTFAPIQIGPQGGGQFQRCHDVRISHNHVQWSPAAPAPFVLEDDSLSGGNPFTAGEKNYVFGNNPIIGNGNPVEFQKAAGSGSTVYGANVWFP